MHAQSEEFIREYMQQAGHKESVDIQVATKYFPLPWRLTSNDVTQALQASLARLGLPKTTLYQQHWCVHAFAHAPMRAVLLTRVRTC